MGKQHTNLATIPRRNVVIVQDHSLRELEAYSLQGMFEVVENQCRA
jgi:hypothetical protein